MWLIGLVVGMAIGAVAFGVEAVIPGAVLGAIIGGVFGDSIRRALGGADAAPNARPASDRERIRLLETKVEWLYSETQRLRGELAALRTPAVPEAADEPAAEAPAPGAEPVVPEVVATADRVEPVGVPLRPPPIPEGPPPSVLSPPPPPPPAPVPSAPSLIARLLAGNPLAMIGVVLLFFGVASALKLIAEYGLFPPTLRVLLAAVAGVAMIVFGFFKAQPGEGDAEARHRTFGLAIQGGGFALLYLDVFFMFARYEMIGHGPAFALFGALGVACVTLAARQDGPALAVLGLSGAFLAPVLAGGRSETPLPLFLYFTLLNVFILAVDWFRAWRVLNIAGFVFTLAVGMLWAIDSYRPEHYALTQGFLILFLLIYSAMPVATALLRAPGEAAWREGLLVFGTPLVGGALQTALVGHLRYGLAWSAFIAAIYYFGLWALMFRRGSPVVRLLERSHLGIALALLTITIPLAFDAQVTSAFWAAEGAAVLWFGVRQRRLLAQSTGFLMQILAGAAFAHVWPHFTRGMPVANDLALGGLLIAGGGLFSARILHGLAQTGEKRLLPPLALLVWALLWWFGVGFAEIGHWLPKSTVVAGFLLFVTISVVALEAMGVAWRWPACRHGVVLLLVALLVAVLTLPGLGRNHLLAGLMLPVWPLALGVHYALLRRHERALEDGALAPLWPAARHLLAWWALVVAVAIELLWVAHQLAPGVELWPLLVVGAVPASALAVAGFANRRGIWPWSAAQGVYVGVGAVPLLIWVMIWAVAANLTHSGAGSGLPYLPLLNFFDLVQIGALAVLWRGGDLLEAGWRKAVAGLAFLWLTLLAARIAHHWGGVPFSGHELFRSTLCQALVTVLWTLLAIGAMIHAGRRASRSGWFVGLALLALVGGKLLLIDLANAGTVIWTASLIAVALLVLAASYFAPAPPKTGEGSGESPP